MIWRIFVLFCLLFAPKCYSSLIEAARYKNYKKMEGLVTAHPNLVNIPTEKGRTPLHEAVNQGFTEGVCLLLKHGASPSVQDSSGWTPLHIAAHCGYQPIVVVLCGFDVDLDCKTSKGESALGLAVRKGHVNIAEELITVGADPDVANNSGMTPLHSACDNGDREMVQRLLQAGASPYVKTKKLVTPLRIAVLQYRSDIVYDILFSLYMKRITESMDKGKTVEHCEDIIIIPDHARTFALVERQIMVDRRTEACKTQWLLRIFKLPVKDIARPLTQVWST